MNNVNVLDWYSFLQSAQTRKPAVPHSESFSGTRTYADAVNLALSGWLDAAQKAKQFSSALFDRISTLIEREEIRYDVTGAALDVGRFLDGEPECWQCFEPVLTDAPSNSIVRICMNGSVSAGITPETIIARGAAIAALVELLEYSSRRVELSIVFSTLSRQGNSDTLVLTVKTADQPLDMPRIAYVLAHPSMLRRLVLGYWEFQPIFPEIRVGFGRPQDYKPEYADVYVPCAVYPAIEWSNADAAQRFILTELERQGIKLQSEVM